MLYSLLHLFGFDVSIEDLKNFRQIGSKTPGHPEFGHTKGVDITTGPLGQGIANAVGMAIAEKHLASVFNTDGNEVINHYTFALAGDGCLMEGISSEACSLAGTLGLGKLILLYDSNSITIEGSTDIAFTEDVAKRYEAYGWDVLTVEDGNDVDCIDQAIISAKKETSKPSIIIIKTQIGYGCPAHQGKESCHGAPLGASNIEEMKKFLGWENQEAFKVDNDVYEYLQQIVNKKAQEEENWAKTLNDYLGQNKEQAILWDKYFNSEVFENIDFSDVQVKTEKPKATRSSSSDVLNAISNYVPNLIGGSADLGPSNKTIMKGKGDFMKGNWAGRNLHFGVREHAMAAIANGIAVHGGLVPYVSTFFVFSDYMKGAMRISALINQRIIYVLTHDSIGVGEDGPTHQPIEHLAMLRSIPNMTVFRPADEKETLAAWTYAIKNANGPTCLILSRQDLVQYEQTSDEAQKGAYVLFETNNNPDTIIMATGSELQVAHDSAKELEKRGASVRLVSMPSWEAFEKQDKEYKESILPSNIRNRVAIEAASSFGWHRYTGLDGKIISIDQFGASGPAKELFKMYGYTVDNIVKTILD